MSNFLENTNTFPTGKLIIYKVKSKHKPKFAKNSTNIVKLEVVNEHYYYRETSKELTPQINESDNITSFGVVPEFKIETTTKVDLEHNAFYFFFMQKLNDSFWVDYRPEDQEDPTRDNLSARLINGKLVNAFVLKEKVLSYTLEDLEPQEISELTLIPIETLKEFEGIEFIVAQNDFEDTNIKLEFNSGSLINLINFYKHDQGRKKHLSYNHTGPRFPYLVYANPIALNNETLNLFLWSFSSNHSINLKGIAPLLSITEDRRVDTDRERLASGYVPAEYLEFNLKAYLFKQEHFELIKSLIESTRIFYKGTKEEKEKLAQDKNITNIRDYNDFIILEAINKNPDTRHLLTTALIMLSEQIESSYCWKGGLNAENSLFCPFTLYYQDTIFKVRSEFLEYNIDAEALEPKKIVSFYNSNLFKYQTYFVNLPSLPSELTEQDFSQKPIEFNEKSYNFNYPFYAFISPQKFIELQKQKLIFSTVSEGWDSVMTYYGHFSDLPGVDNLGEWNDRSLWRRLKDPRNKELKETDYIWKISEWKPYQPEQLNETGNFVERPVQYSSARIHVRRNIPAYIPPKDLTIAKNAFEVKKFINNIFNDSGDTYELHFTKEEDLEKLREIEIRALFLETVKITFNNSQTLSVEITQKDTNPIHKIYIW